MILSRPRRRATAAQYCKAGSRWREYRILVLRARARVGVPQNVPLRFPGLASQVLRGVLRSRNSALTLIRQVDVNCEHSVAGLIPKVSMYVCSVL